MVILQVQLFTHVICFLLHPNYIINIENGKAVYIATVIMTDKFWISALFYDECYLMI